MSLPDEVAAAHRVLAQYYREPVLTPSQFCERLGWYVQALCENGSDGAYGAPTAQALREHGGAAIFYGRKSNLLYRLLYLGQELRTEKCPTHGGRWSGYADGPSECECQVGPDLTGWLP